MINRKRAINRLIRKTFVEMCLLIFAVIGSYFVFSRANLSESSKIAESYSTSENALQVMVGHNDNVTYLNNGDNLIDKTILTVRNPNRGEKLVDIYLVIVNPGEVNLDGMFINYLGQITPAKEAFIDMNTYKLKIYSGKISGYENLKGDVLIYSKNYVNSLKYTFAIEEISYK